MFVRLTRWERNPSADGAIVLVNTDAVTYAGTSRAERQVGQVENTTLILFGSGFELRVKETLAEVETAFETAQGRAGK